MCEFWQKKIWLIVMAAVWVALAAGCEAEAQQAEVEDLGELYSLTLPAGDWQQQGPNIWALVQNDEVVTELRIWLVRLADCPRSEAVKQLQDEGYAELAEQPGFWQRAEEGLQSRARLLTEEQDCWLVCCCWPVAEAQWEESLTKALASFELVQE